MGPKRKMFIFSRVHSHALTNATRRHEYFRGLSRLLPVPGVWVSFLELRFLRKMALLALDGRPLSPSQKALSTSKGTYFQEKECAKWYQNFSNVKICGRQRRIFVIVCGNCQSVDKKQFSKWHKWRRRHKCCTKIKPQFNDYQHRWWATVDGRSFRHRARQSGRRFLLKWGTFKGSFWNKS